MVSRKKPKMLSWTAFNKDGLYGVHIVAKNRPQALKFARDIHGRGAQVEKR